MKKPKHEEIRNIDTWICCWCGKDNTNGGDLADYDYAMGEDTGVCRHCGKRNKLYFSIEFMSQPDYDEE